jgi:hypothetical protein
MNISHVHMIYSFTSGSRGSPNPWVVPHHEDIDSYGFFIRHSLVEVFDLTVSSSSTDTGQQLHIHMECDHLTLLLWFVYSPSSQDILDFDFPS